MTFTRDTLNGLNAILKRVHRYVTSVHNDVNGIAYSDRRILAIPTRFKGIGFSDIENLTDDVTSGNVTTGHLPFRVGIGLHDTCTDFDCRHECVDDDLLHWFGSQFYSASTFAYGIILPDCQRIAHSFT